MITKLLLHILQSTKVFLVPQMRFFSSQYYNSNIGLFSMAPYKVIHFILLCYIFYISSLLLFLIFSLKLSFFPDSDSWSSFLILKVYAMIGSGITILGAIQKRSHKLTYKKLRKEVKSEKFCYHIVGKVIIKWGAKVQYCIAILGKRKDFVLKIISYLGGTNNIFVDCKMP